MKGSLTAEAAYIFPISIFMIGILCILGVYQYNQAILKLTGYECILSTMEERSDGENVMRETLAERALEHGQKRTFGINELGAEIKMTAAKIVLIYEGRQTILNVPIQVEIVYQRSHPEQVLRISKGIGKRLR